MSALTARTLLESFERQYDLVLPDLDRVCAHIERRNVARRENAFRQDEPAVHVYFVRSGILKQVYTSEDGGEWIKSFTGPGDLFACIYAISHRTPARFGSVAIEPSVVERLPFRVLEAAAESAAPWQKALRIAFQRLAEIKVQREQDLLTLTPRQMYAKLVQSAPSWLTRVPQKDLAGYLGVTAVGLNRIIRSTA